ncbi:hypothetical protein WT15_23865 [Burkholderia stagnalis]|nr:hypothetical protein WT15_23865 [Burkholderia stagnalis]KWO27054.1 hypothetical protein WT96_31260 [Burkholderia stagnalis]KWO45051.1 hypothetical protein WT95_26900 [Burkholderia stagnalis]
MRHGHGFHVWVFRCERATNAHRRIGRHGHPTDFIGQPARDGVHVRAILTLLRQNDFQDAIADGHMTADSVLHVLENFIGARTVAEAHYGTAAPVAVDLRRFDDADLVAPVVVHQVGPAIV